MCKIYNSKVVYDTQPWFNGNTTYQEELTNVSCSLKNTNEYLWCCTGASITTTVYHKKNPLNWGFYLLFISSLIITAYSYFLN
jgi:hypothetical protein